MGQAIKIGLININPDANNGRMLVEDNDGVKTYALKEVSFSY